MKAGLTVDLADLGRCPAFGGWSVCCAMASQTLQSRAGSMVSLRELCACLSTIVSPRRLRH